MRLTLFALATLLICGCYSIKMVEGSNVTPADGNFRLAVTMKTKQGPETVSIATESNSLCKWLQTNIKKYGNMAHVEAVGKCSKENSGELQKKLSRGPSR